MHTRLYLLTCWYLTLINLRLVMYKTLTQKLSNIFGHFTSNTLNEKDVSKALAEIENAFIEADVARSAIEAFKTHVSTQSQTIEKEKKLDAKSHLMKIVRDALLSMLSHHEPLPQFKSNQLQIILTVGLQGAGKTTTCAKIAKYIQSTQPKANIMMASVDIYRPKAIEQLNILAKQIGVNFHPHHDGINPIDICQHAIDHAKRSNQDILIIDTAGRLDIDEDRMAELKSIHKTIKPQHTFYVVDSMMGQSALKTAQTFNETVAISGIILSKLDSDTKGGVALSVKSVIQKPIFWVGMGEALDQLEVFDPKRIADQLLDMGDIVGLAQKAQKHFDAKQSEKMTQRLQKGQFTLNDMLEQIQQINKMGGLSSILKMLPGAAKLPDNVMKMVEDDTKIKTIQSLIQSMTPLERNRPELIRNQKSRQSRVLKGSGRNKNDLNELLKGYDRMKKMTDKLKGGKMKALMQQFAGSSDNPWNQ